MKSKISWAVSFFNMYFFNDTYLLRYTIFFKLLELLKEEAGHADSKLSQHVNRNDTLLVRV